MKSDREFIDGIYEKAKNYTTEENSTSLTTYKRKTVRPYVWQTLSCAAALLLLCVAIDGINGKELLQRNSQSDQTAIEQETGIAFARSMPGQQKNLVTGEISEIVAKAQEAIDSAKAEKKASLPATPDLDKLIEEETAPHLVL